MESREGHQLTLDFSRDAVKGVAVDGTGARNVGEHLDAIVDAQMLTAHSVRGKKPVARHARRKMTM